MKLRRNAVFFGGLWRGVTSAREDGRCVLEWPPLPWPKA